MIGIIAGAFCLGFIIGCAVTVYAAEEGED